MSHPQDHPLAPMVRKLELWNPLSEEDRKAVLALPYTERSLSAGQFIIWEGDKPQNSCVLNSGFAYRHKSAGNGGRQIMSIHVMGDIVDLVVQKRVRAVIGEVVGFGDLPAAITAMSERRTTGRTIALLP